MDATAATVWFIVDRFGLGPGAAELRPMARGAMGRIWQLRLKTGPMAGTVWAVKELFWAADERALARTVEFRDAAAAAGIASPAHLRTVTGTYLLELPAESGGGNVRVQGWVQGRVVDPGSPAAAGWIGRALGRMHSLAWPVDDPPGDWYQTVPSPDQWDEQLATAHRAGLTWASRLDAALDNLASLSGLVTPADPARLVVSHRDEQPSNCLVGSSGHQLIDWDDVGSNAPERVLACVLWDWHRRDGDLDRPQIRRTVAAYRDAGGTADMDSGSFATVIATYFNYLHVQVDLALDPTQQHESHAHAAREVDRLLASPPSIEAVEGVLSAAAST